MLSAADFTDREFPMSDKNFSQIKSIAYSHTGINLNDHKKNMIYGRLARRLRRLGLKNFDDYCALLDTGNKEEMLEFTNAITTNLTSFFREVHHFEFLKQKLLPSLIQKKRSEKKLRIWSAGCSTGEEPYSIAMVIRSLSTLDNWDVKILATDLDTNVIDTGKKGIYSCEKIETIPSEYHNYFSKDESSENVEVKDRVKQLISFKRLNLLQDWPMKGRFDFIFCRNVVIYFDNDTQRKLFDRYANILTTDGHLFIGHSENLNKVCDRFSSIGRTVYLKNK